MSNPYKIMFGGRPSYAALILRGEEGMGLWERMEELHTVCRNTSLEYSDQQVENSFLQLQILRRDVAKDFYFKYTVCIERSNSKLEHRILSHVAINNDMISVITLSTWEEIMLRRLNLDDVELTTY